MGQQAPNFQPASARTGQCFASRMELRGGGLCFVQANAGAFDRVIVNSRAMGAFSGMEFSRAEALALADELKKAVLAARLSVLADSEGGEL